MRTTKQYHDTLGRFAAHEDHTGVVPADWSLVTAHYLDDDEKEALTLYQAMQDATTPEGLAIATIEFMVWLMDRRDACIDKLVPYGTEMPLSNRNA